MESQIHSLELQETKLAIQTANTISNSLLFSLGRQYLGRPFQQRDYINYFPVRTPSIGQPYLLRLEQLGDLKANSLKQQLTALQISLSACHNLGKDKLIFMIDSNGSNSHLHVGTRSRNSDFVDNLQAMLQGNLPGTKLQQLYFTKASEFKTQIEEPLKKFTCPIAITGIPSLHPGINLGYSQLDCLLRTLDGSPFMYMVIAEPMLETQVNRIIYNLRELLGLVYSLSKLTLDKNFTKSISEQSQQTNTKIQNPSTSAGNSSHLAKDVKTLIKFIFLGLENITQDPGYKLALKIGEIAAEHIIPDMVKEFSEISLQPSTKETFSTSNTQITGISQSTAQTLRREYINAHAQRVEAQIKQSIERFETARALGCWNVGVYFLGEDPKIARQGANSFKGIFSGEKSYFEPLRVHELYKYPADLLTGTLTDLGNFRQPNLALIDPKNPQQPLDHPLGSAFNRLTTPLNTQELSALINFPGKSIQK